MVHANESKCVSFRGVAKQITDNLARHLHFISEKTETQRKAVCPKTWREVPGDAGLELESPRLGPLRGGDTVGVL